jgi:hypothetical protein
MLCRSSLHTLHLLARRRSGRRSVVVAAIRRRGRLHARLLAVVAFVGVVVGAVVLRLLLTVGRGRVGVVAVARLLVLLVLVAVRVHVVAAGAVLVGGPFVARGHPAGAVVWLRAIAAAATSGSPVGRGQMPVPFFHDYAAWSSWPGAKHFGRGRVQGKKTYMQQSSERIRQMTMIPTTTQRPQKYQPERLTQSRLLELQ